METITLPTATLTAWACTSLILLAVVSLGSMALTAWLAHTQARETRQLTARVAMLAGLHPHHAAPETFLPGGMSVGAYEKAKTEAPQPPNGYRADARDLEDEAAQDAREFVTMLQARAAQNRAAKEAQRLRGEIEEQPATGRRVVTEDR